MKSRLFLGVAVGIVFMVAGSVLYYFPLSCVVGTCVRPIIESLILVVVGALIIALSVVEPYLPKEKQ